MGYVFDGEAVTGKAADLLQRSILAQFLAVILFAFSALIGVPIAVMAVISVVAGAPRLLILTALASPLAVSCGWIGKSLWSGRPRPNWYIVSVMLIVSLLAFLGVLLLLMAWLTVAISLV